MGWGREAAFGNSRCARDGVGRTVEQRERAAEGVLRVGVRRETHLAQRRLRRIYVQRGDQYVLRGRDGTVFETRRRTGARKGLPRVVQIANHLAA